jgi:hypothetical protein
MCLACEMDWLWFGEPVVPAGDAASAAAGPASASVDVGATPPAEPLPALLRDAPNPIRATEPNHGLFGSRPAVPDRDALGFAFREAKPAATSSPFVCEETPPE